MNRIILAVALSCAQVALAQAPAPKPAAPKPAPAVASTGGSVTVRTVPNLPSYKALKFPPLKQVTIPKPEEFTLPNGMKVYLLEDHELPLVSGFALVRTGNLFDPPDKRGLAEVMGTVLRSGGTKAHTGDQLDTTLENIAASVESSVAETRASVSFSSLRENTDQVMSLFHEVLTSPEFRQDRLDLAKTQIRSSISRRNDDPGGIAGREFSSIVYGKDNPYGWELEYEHIDRIQRDDLVKFYKRFYFPANIRLAVYGDFPAADMRARIERLFAGWNDQQPPVPPFPAFQGKPAPGIFLAEKGDVTQTFFEIGHTGGLLSDKDYPALEVCSDILGSGFSSRLIRRVRTELGYVYNISASWGAGYLAPGLFQISGSTKSQSTTETLEAVRQELDKIRNAEVTDEELKTAKDRVLNSFVFAFDRPSKTLNRLVTYDYYGYPRDFIFQYQKAVGTVTKADILRVAKQYFQPGKLTFVAVGNPGEFGKALATLDLPLQKIDLTIPEPKAAGPKVDAATIEQGRKMLERAQTAMGGAEKLAAIKDLDRSAEGTAQMGGAAKVKQRERAIYPNHLREDQELPFGKIIVYSDGKSGWIVGPQGAQPLPPFVLKQVNGELFHDLTTLALSDRTPGRTFSASGENEVTITDAGGLRTRLILDPATGLPARQIYDSVQVTGPSQPVEEAYSDWREVNGVKAPFHIIIQQGGQKSAEFSVTELKFNSGLKAEELSKKP